MNVSTNILLSEPSAVAGGLTHTILSLWHKSELSTFNRPLPQTVLTFIEFQIEKQNINPRLAQKAELSALGELRDDLPHLFRA
jgi:hypothetical protein